MEMQPIQYHFEVYEESLGTFPTLSWSSNYPFPAMKVGDFYDHKGSDRWHNQLRHGERFRVSEVEHSFWEVRSSHICHKLRICLEVVDDR